MVSLDSLKSAGQDVAAAGSSIKSAAQDAVSKVPGLQNALGAIPGLSSFAVSHATLSIYHPPASAGGSLGGKIADVNFTYNPGQIQLSMSANWGAPTGISFERGAIPEFYGVQPPTMSLEVMIDASSSGILGSLTGGGSVATDIQNLMSCCNLDPQSVDSDRPSPPWVKLSWGSQSMTQFTAVMQSVSVNFKRFSPDGTVNRATCQLSLMQIPQTTLGQNPTSGALNASRAHSVVAGDSLASLAWSEYGDPTVWRVIAQANGIDDPMRLTPGRELLLPSAEEVRR
jgi:hypothetical protein